VEERVVSAGAGEGQSVSGCVVWLGWMLGGNLVLLALVLLIMREGRWSLSGKDALFFGVIAVVLALRYVDLTRFGGKQVDGTPAPPGLFKSYAPKFVGTWLALWAVAHSVEWLS